MTTEKEIVELTREGMIEYLSEGYSQYLEDEMLRALGRISDLSFELKNGIWDSKIENALLLNFKLYKGARAKMNAFHMDDGDYYREALKSIFLKELDSVE